MLIPLLLASPLLVTAQRLDPTTAQAVADALTSYLNVPNGCISSAALPPNSASKNLAALWLRGAFHDAGTWDPKDATGQFGGADGTLTNMTDAGEHAGLMGSTADLYARVAAKINIASVSRADTIAMAGQIAVKHCGGPDIPYRGGRVDGSLQMRNLLSKLPRPSDCIDTIKLKFRRMEFTNGEIVAIILGSHSMGGLHRANAGTVTNQEFQPFDGTPGVFDNDVFKRALEGDCALHIDCQIAFDKELRPFVEQYANSQPQFFRDYTIAYQKMMGMTPSRGSLTGAMALNVPAHANLVQEGTQALPFRRIPKVVNQACPRGFS